MPGDLVFVLGIHHVDDMIRTPEPTKFHYMEHMVSHRSWNIHIENISLFTTSAKDIKFKIEQYNSINKLISTLTSIAVDWL